MSIRKSGIILLGMAIGISAICLKAQDTETQPAVTKAEPATPAESAERGSSNVSHVYPVRDLVGMSIPPEEVGVEPPTMAVSSNKYGASSQQPGIFGGLESANRAGPVVSIIEQILPGKSILIDGVLVVSASEEDHRKVAAILTEFRKARYSPPLTLIVKWVSAGDDVAAKALASERPGEAFEQALADGNATLACCLRAGCVDGKPVVLTAGPAQSLVIDLTPVVGTDVAAWNPTIVLVQWGAYVKATAAISPDGLSANLSLNAVISDPNETSLNDMGDILRLNNLSTTRPVGPSPIKGIDRVEFQSHCVNTTIKTPLNTTLLAGTANPVKIGRFKALYLLVRLNSPKENHAGK